MRRLLLIACVLVALLVPGSVSADPTLDSLTNQFRAANGLAALATSPALTALAAQRAQETSVTFAHVDIGARVSAAYPCWRLWGENIAWVSGTDDPSWFATAWENSPEHRANLLGPFTQQGSAIFTTADGRHFAAQVFVQTCSVPAAPEPTAPPAPTPPPPAPAVAPVIAPPPVPTEHRRRHPLVPWAGPLKYPDACQCAVSS